MSLPQTLLDKQLIENRAILFFKMPGDVVWFATFIVASSRSPSRKVGASSVSATRPQLRPNRQFETKTQWQLLGDMPVRLANVRLWAG